MAYKFIDEEPKKENFAQTATRNVARTASNLGTRAVGLPGDILSLVNDYIAKPTAEFLTGKPGVGYEQSFLGKAIPTTEQHRKAVESVSGEYLKPKNEVEKFADNLIEDAALLFTPGGLTTKSGKVLKGSEKILRNFTKSLGAQVVGKAVTDIGGNEKAGNWAKAGTLFALSLIDKPAAAKQVANLYKNAEQSIPPGAAANASSLETSMNGLINKITKGRPKSNLSTPEKFVVDQAENVSKLIQNGRIPVEQAWAQLRTVNQELESVLPTLPWKQRKGIKTLALDINHSLNKTLANYGHMNKEFAKNFHPAQEAFSTIAKSNFVGNWVQKNVKSPLITEGLMALFGNPLAKGAAKLALPYKGAQLMYRVSKSPALRKIYQNTLKAATEENAIIFNKHLKELDGKLQEEESKHKYRFID